MRDYRAAVALIGSMRALLARGEHRFGFVTSTREEVNRSLARLLAALERPGEALSVTERARGRVLLEELALVPLAAPPAADPRLVEHERHLLGQLRVLLAIPERRLDAVRRTEQELAEVWDALAPAAPQYVALHHAIPAGPEEVAACLADV